MNAQDIEEMLEGIIDESTDNEDSSFGEYIKSVRSFSSAGMLSMNKGLVLTMQDGSEFQITIVQSKLSKEK